MTPDQPKFLKLQSFWDAQLKASGFQDAEQRDGKLKDWHSFRFVKPGFAKNNCDDMENTAQYYRATGVFLHSHPFSNEDELKIWELHSEGKSVKKYRSENVRCTTRVYQILRLLIAAMKKSWKSPESSTKVT